MLPQYMALFGSFVSFVSQFVKKKCCVRSLDFIVGASPPCENMCVRSLGYIVGVSPPPCENKALIHWRSTHGAGHIPCIFSLHAAYSTLRNFLLCTKFNIPPRHSHFIKKILWKSMNIKMKSYFLQQKVIKFFFYFIGFKVHSCCTVWTTVQRSRIYLQNNIQNQIKE